MPGSVLIDITRLIGRTARGLLPTGIDRVCLAYLRHFGPRAQAVVQQWGWRRIFPMRESQRLFELLLEPREDFKFEARLAITRACLPPWPSQDGARRVLLHLGHSGLDEPQMASWVQARSLRVVFMVHDLIPLSNPEYCRPGEGARHGERMRTMLRAGSGLIANSRSTLDELAAFARREGLQVPPAVVAPLAAAPLGPAGDGAPLPHPYFVVLGTIEPRKNHWLLLHVWRDLVARLGDKAPHLVVIGQRGWECENVVDMLERCEALRLHVHELGSAGDEALARHLRHARALLFPSFAEGFGMPLVEALSAGTPVLASPLPAFREIAGDVPDYIDPLDGPSWAAAIEDYAAPASARRDRQLARMTTFRAPDWSTHFARVEHLLAQLA
jgi:glycosyltransferase involved in cell wall biosynthesis